MSDTWTDERVEKLKELHLQGLSSSRIAVVLGGGLTRNAVIGKAARLGLVHGAAVKRETIAQTNKLRAKAERTPKPKAEQPKKPEPAKAVPIRPNEATAFACPSKRLGELGRGECHWPVNDPGPGRMDETLFCAAPGAPALGEGMPYCEHHQRRAVVPDKPRKPATVPTAIHRRAS